MTVGSMAKYKTLSTRPEVARCQSVPIQRHDEGHIPSKTWSPHPYDKGVGPDVL